MKPHPLSNSGQPGKTRVALRALMVMAMALAVLPLVAQGPSKSDQEKQDKKNSSKSIGFVLSAEATSKDLGLPIYPGARQVKDNSDDSSALNVGLWGGSSAFRLVVLKLESEDSPDKVAAYYRKALGKYGAVRDCGKGGSKTNSAQSNECDNDKPAKGGYVYEVGTKEKMHVAGVEPGGKGSVISLVYVEAPKSESEKKTN
jgi:hypothetical protein